MPRRLKGAYERNFMNQGHPLLILILVGLMILLGSLQISDNGTIQDQETFRDLIDSHPSEVFNSQSPISQRKSSLTRAEPNYTELINYDDVLVIRNLNSPTSMQIADYFQSKRNILPMNICNITAPTTETINRATFDSDIRTPIENYIQSNGLLGQINYIVTTKGVPLRISEDSHTWDRASVDSELTLILGSYQGGIGQPYWVTSPYFDPPSYEEFSWTQYRIFLVTRFTGYDFDDIKSLIDKPEKSIGRRGTFVLDVDPGKDDGGGYQIGNDWMRDANQSLTAKGFDVILDETNTFLTEMENVSGYCSWGSNDGRWYTGVNLNFGFETDSNGDDIPDNWFVESDVSNDEIQRNNSRALGSWSLKINRSIANINYSAISQNVTVKPDVRYFLRGQVNFSSVSGGKGAHLRIKAYDSLDQLVWEKNGTPRTSPLDLWRPLNQVVYEPIDNVTKITVSAIFSEASGEAFFDDVRLIEIRPHNSWLPGAIVETYVSTGGRSFTYGTQYGQSLVADLIMDGVTGTKGYVYEPFLDACAHPDIYLDAYTDGFKLAESYYMASEFLGWMDLVIGDPKVAPYNPDIVPDLSIVPQDITFSDDTPQVGDVIDIFVTVENLGLAAASDVEVKFYVGDIGGGGILIGSRTMDIPGSGSNATSIQWDTTGYIGDHNITVVIDPQDLYYEADEANNMAFRPITVNTGYPIADAGLDGFVDEDALYNFNGSGSSDNTSVANYTWNFGDGSYGYGVTPAHNYTSQGLYFVVLNVTNVFGLWSLDTVNITVNNVAPTADAGEDLFDMEGMKIEFDGSGSTDTPSDVDTLNYTWNFGDGKYGYGKYPNHTYEDDGIFQVTLEVRDNDLATGIDTAYVTLDNSPPIIDPVPPQMSLEDSTYNFQITASDVSGDTITFSDNFTLFDIDPSSGSISFTPENKDVGVYIINITATDDDDGEGFMEFELTVQNTNDPPFIVSVPITEAMEETLYRYQVIVEDDDLLVSPFEVIAYSFDSAPTGMEIDSNGLITWIPDDSQASHMYSVVIRASDGEEYDLQSYSINVSNINDDPVIESSPVTFAVEDMSYTYDVNASDVDFLDVLTYKLDVAPNGMSINQGNGMIQWIPTNDFVGNNDVIVNVTDSQGAYHTQEFSILVINTNDAPELEPFNDLYTYEDSHFYYQVNASDPDTNDKLSFYDDCDLFEIDRNSGIISFTPSNDDVGIYTVEILVKDSAGSEDTVMVTLTVTNTNDPPELGFIGDWQVTEEEPFTMFVNASDIDPDDSYTFFDNTTLFDIEPNTGEISFTPTNEDVGMHFVNISVVDEEGGIDFQRVLFIVLNTNDPPEIETKDVPGFQEVLNLNPGSTFTFTIEVSDEDQDDSQTFSDDTDLFDIDPKTGEITFTPEPKDAGVHTIKITVTDGEGESDHIFITIDIKGEKKEEFNLIWIILPIVMIVILVLVLFLILKGKRKKPKDEIFFSMVDQKNISVAKNPQNYPPPPHPP
jgi:uncharacterized protein (TIGR03790 family)